MSSADALLVCGDVRRTICHASLNRRAPDGFRRERVDKSSRTVMLLEDVPARS
jgi:hypothetical protein